MKKWLIRLDPRRWVGLSSPVTLGFTLLSLAALAVSALTGGRANRLLFSAWRSSPLDPLFWPRLFLHVLGHSGLTHFTANMGLLLVLGPGVEEKYGGKRLLLMILGTALVGGLVHVLVSAHTAVLGASGVVFMLIFLSAVAGKKDGKVPLTLILVIVIYLGREVADGLFSRDAVSQLSHIAGGACGIAFGLWGRKKPR